jgi:hypothetical protein
MELLIARQKDRVRGLARANSSALFGIEPNPCAAEADNPAAKRIAPEN